MKRMVNGAVSDISHAMAAAAASSSESPTNPVEQLMANSEMLRLNFESLHLLPISESAPTSVSSSAQDLLSPSSGAAAPSILDQPLVEAPEEVERAEERKHSEPREDRGTDMAMDKPATASVGIQVDLLKPEAIGIQVEKKLMLKKNLCSLMCTITKYYY